MIQPMRITEYNVVENMADGRSGEREITTGCVRFYVGHGDYIEVQPSRYHPDRIELRISGQSARHQIVVAPRAANTIEIGAEE